VVENVLSFDAGFWVRLAARIDLCKSDDDKAWFHIYRQFCFLWMLLSSTSVNLTVIGFSVLRSQKDYEELAENVMNIVDRLVHKTDVRTMFHHA